MLRLYKIATGYDWDAGKSNNAVDAENSGIFPSSIIAKKLNIPIELVRAVGPSEYHHTGKYFNKTDYYDINEVQEWLNDPENAEDIQEIYTKLRSKKEFVPKQYNNHIVTFLEWGGTRKHPKAEEVTYENVTIEDRGGNFLIITLANGKTFKKGKETYGFSIDGKDPQWFLREQGEINKGAGKKLALTMKQDKEKEKVLTLDTPLTSKDPDALFSQMGMKLSRTGKYILDNYNASTFFLPVVEFGADKENSLGKLAGYFGVPWDETKVQSLGEPKVQFDATVGNELRSLGAILSDRLHEQFPMLEDVNLRFGWGTDDKFKLFAVKQDASTI